MSADLTEILNEWPYDPEQTVRIVVAQDGRSVLQVRLPLGIEQYEMSGRPDGARPRGFDSILDYTQDRLKRHIVETGGDSGFHITTDEAAALQSEGVLFYYRYLLLFQMRYFDMVIRDTDHNLHLCDILERYCENEEARNAVLQFQPYILRMNAAARAIAIGEGALSGDYHDVIDGTIQRIEGLEEIDSPAFQFERIRSVNYLRTLLRKLDNGDATPEHATEDDEAEDERDEDDQPVQAGPVDDTTTGNASDDAQSDRRRRLEQALQDAIETENYERAAQIRDWMRRDDF